MFGLIVISVPLGIAISLSAVAITHVEPDGSAGGVGANPAARKIKEVP